MASPIALEPEILPATALSPVDPFASREVTMEHPEVRSSPNKEGASGAVRKVPKRIERD